MPYQSNLRAAEMALLRGIDAGLTVAAREYTTAVRQRLARGFTTGNFTTGALARRVIYSRPFDFRGARTIAMGTSKPAGFAYEIAWELGHNNVFTRRHMRVPVWQPFLEARANQIAATVAFHIRRETGVSFGVSLGTVWAPTRQQFEATPVGVFV